DHIQAWLTSRPSSAPSPYQMKAVSGKAREAPGCRDWDPSGTEKLPGAELDHPEEDEPGAPVSAERCRRLELQLAALREELASCSCCTEELAAKLSACDADTGPSLEEASDACAQEDVLQVLKLTMANFNEPQAPHASSAGSLQDGKALLAMQEHLVSLRGKYLHMGQQCQAFEHHLGEIEAEEERCLREADRNTEAAAAAECRSSWAAALSEHTLWVDEGERHLEQLGGEFLEAQLRLGAVRRESTRLEAAARQDECTLEQFRLQLRRLHARNAGLEVEAQLLGLAVL
ncbi:unnamed protein product, partial [Polarella glacialis]